MTKLLKTLIKLRNINHIIEATLVLHLNSFMKLMLIDDMEVVDENLTYDFTPYHDEPIEYTPPKPHIEPQLRRSIRAYDPFQIYHLHLYVMISDNGESEHCQEVIANVTFIVR